MLGLKPVDEMDAIEVFLEVDSGGETSEAVSLTDGRGGGVHYGHAHAVVGGY